MHSFSRGGNGYGHQQQQPYSSEAAYTTLGSRYSGSSIGGRDGVSQSGGSPRLGIFGSVPEGDAVGYKGHGQPSGGTHYVDKYSSVYESSGQQIPQSGAKGSIQPVLPKFTTGDYALSSSRGYGGVGDQLYSDKISDYTSGEKHQYVQRQSAYIGRDMPNEAGVRYAESANSAHTHQTEPCGRLDQTLLLRQEQLLKAHSLQSTSADGNARESDYGAPRSTSLRPTIQDHRQDQDHRIYAARIDLEPHTLSYSALCNPSILGAGSSGNVDDAFYVQASLNPGYGVVLPPGRDYGAGKGVYGTSLDQDYHMLVRASQSSIDRELDRREKDLQELRERVKDRERERDRERARKRDRLRERERVCGRDLERGRVRERERKKKAKARKRKAILDSKREGTSPVPSKERRGASFTKDRRTLLRGSSHGSSHRRSSPVKERREYVCKVHSSKLVDVERDYLSLDKRYPKLVVSPECAKVVVNWPKENLKLSLYAPVSFEHDFVEDDAAKKIVPISKQPAGEMVETVPKGTVWNSKVILMSGLSQKSLEELSSDRIYGERIPHFCNMLRFAILKKENSLMAIGGRWDPSDGGDPSVDDDSLVKTILRCAKEIAHLDLTSCKRWNRFLESWKGTVIYVPDLSDCLPSLESWHNQWLDHKKVVSERAQLKTPVKQNAEEKKGGTEDVVHTKDKKKDTPSSGNKVKVNPIPKETESKQKVETTDDVSVQVDQKEIVQTPGSVEPKKKVIKQKVVKKKDRVVAEAVVASDELPDVGEKTVESSSAQGMKTLKRKKIVKKLVANATESKAKQNADEIVADTAAKTTVKKKIVNKVPKKSVASEDALKSENEGLKDEESTKKIDSKTELESKTSKKQDKLTGKKTNQTSLVSAPDSEKEKVSVQDDHSKPKGKDMLKDEKGRESRGGKADSKGRSDKEKKRSEEPPRHPGFILQTTGSKDSKTRSLSLSLDSLLDYSDEDLQETTFEISLFAESLYEMLQYEMGCRLLTFLEICEKEKRTKRQREDAPKKGTGEITSLGKRVKIKEGNDVKSEKNHSDDVKGIVKEEKTENDQPENVKTHCTEEASDEEENPKEDPAEEEGPQYDMEDNPEEEPQDDPEIKKDMIDAGSQADDVSEKEKVEETDKKVESESKNEEDVKKDNNNNNVKDKQQEAPKGGSPVFEAKNKRDINAQDKKISKKEENKEKKKNVNKELLQAFRFFDRNRIGYIRVEDMKLIIHKLGKFLSHRAVKDMVLSAVLER